MSPTSSAEYTKLGLLVHSKLQLALPLLYFSVVFVMAEMKSKWLGPHNCLGNTTPPHQCNVKTPPASSYSISKRNNYLPMHSKKAALVTYYGSRMNY